MKKILVPTDFSECAGNALNFAVQTSRLLSTRVIVMHVFEQQDDLYTDYMGVNREYNQTMLQDIAQKLEKLKAGIAEREGIEITTFVSKVSLQKSILQATVANEIDLVIMGTLGASGIKEKIWGSNTAHTIGNCPVPLLVIPFNYKWKKPVKLLLATNHFEKQPANIEFIFELADLYMAKVEAAVFTNDEQDSPATFLQHADEIPQYENTLKKMYGEETLAVRQVFGNDFEQSIRDYIERNEVDILVMIAYRHTFTGRLFHKSVTKQMAYHSTVPLLLIPGKPE